jgi:hypothetical protein
MFSRLLRHSAAVSLAVVAVACASTHAGGGAVAPTANLPGTPDCFWLRNVYDWTVLNNSELIVHVPLPQNAYLVKLFQPVFDLDFHLGLGFQDADRTGRICGPSSDYLLVPNYTPRRIPIVAVQRLTASEQVQLLRAAKKPVPRVLLQPQPAGTS